MLKIKYGARTKNKREYHYIKRDNEDENILSLLQEL